MCSNVLVIRTHRKPYGHTKKINCVLPSYKINWDVQRNLLFSISTSYNQESILLSCKNLLPSPCENSKSNIYIFTSKFSIYKSIHQLANGLDVKDCFRSFIKESLIALNIHPVLDNNTMVKPLLFFW